MAQTTVSPVLDARSPPPQSNSCTSEQRQLLRYGVPSVPELALSSADAFALIDRQTAPSIQVQTRDICPSAAYLCREPVRPNCGRGGTTNASADSAPSPVFDGAMAAPADMGPASAPAPPPVLVYNREVIGSYDTVTFGAGDAMAAVQWLNDNGFITNQTMAPYMQPYLDGGNVFIAAKLVPGAGSDEIQPLRMRYEATHASIPIQLTAIAAEPYMTITAFIYGNSTASPLDGHMVELDQGRLSADPKGRSNYPMLLSRTLEEAPPKGFVREYAGAPPRATLSQCCAPPVGLSPVSGPPQMPPPAPDLTMLQADAGAGDAGAAEPEPEVPQPSPGDPCGLANDEVCQCPGTQLDAADCGNERTTRSAEALVSSLANKFSVFTRLTIRLSPEMMTFDPTFELEDTSGNSSRLTLDGERLDLSRCEDDIVGPAAYERAKQLDGCSALYCGSHGTCAATDAGPGCVCDEGFIGRAFEDSDSALSITCVPETHTVDLAAGGLDLPSACDGVVVANGKCVDLGGFSATGCVNGFAAVISDEGVVCSRVTFDSGSPGAEPFSTLLTDLDVCNPKPPQCSRFGRLKRLAQTIPGVSCEQNEPGPGWFESPVALTCADMAPGAPDLVDPTTTDPVPSPDSALPQDGQNSSFVVPQPEKSRCSYAPARPQAGWVGLLLGLVFASASFIRTWKGRRSRGSFSCSIGVWRFGEERCGGHTQQPVPRSAA